MKKPAVTPTEPFLSATSKRNFLQKNCFRVIQNKQRAISTIKRTIQKSATRGLDASKKQNKYTLT